jgi:hypothetical protein
MNNAEKSNKCTDEKMNFYNSEEKIDRNSPKVEKHIRISKSTAEKIERYCRVHKNTSESDVVEKTILFWFLNKTLRVESNSLLRPEITSCEEPCLKCGHIIPTGEDGYYNKNRGWLCLDCCASLGSKVLAKKKLMEKRYQQSLSLLRAKVEEETVKLEGVENKKDIHELLLQMKQSMILFDDNERKEESFFKTFPQYSDAEVRDNLQKRSTGANIFYDSLKSLSPILQVLEQRASDQIALEKRRTKRLEPSIEDTQEKFLKDMTDYP